MRYYEIELTEKQDDFMSRFFIYNKDFTLSGKMLALLKILIIEHNVSSKKNIIKLLRRYNKLSGTHIDFFKEKHPTLTKSICLWYFRNFFLHDDIGNL